MKLALATIAAFGILAGCEQGGSTGGTPPPAPKAAAATSPKVEKAVAITRELEAGGAAEQVLQKHGMTEQQFEDLMYEIASDPVLSDQYSAKMGG